MPGSDGGGLRLAALHRNSPMRCIVTKGGWSWMGLIREPGEVIDQPAEWVANRVADGLVEPVADLAPEAAVLPPPENTSLPTARPRAKSR